VSTARRISLGSIHCSVVIVVVILQTNKKVVLFSLRHGTEEEKQQITPKGDEKEFWKNTKVTTDSTTSKTWSRDTEAWINAAGIERRIDDCSSSTSAERHSRNR